MSPFFVPLAPLEGRPLARARTAAGTGLDWVERIFLGPRPKSSQRRRRPESGPKMLAESLREAGILIVVFTFLDSFQKDTTLTGWWIPGFMALGLAAWLGGVIIERSRVR